MHARINLRKLLSSFLRQLNCFQFQSQNEVDPTAITQHTSKNIPYTRSFISHVLKYHFANNLTNTFTKTRNKRSAIAFCTFSTSALLKGLLEPEFSIFKGCSSESWCPVCNTIAFPTFPGSTFAFSESTSTIVATTKSFCPSVLPDAMTEAKRSTLATIIIAIIGTLAIVIGTLAIMSGQIPWVRQEAEFLFLTEFFPPQSWVASLK